MTDGKQLPLKRTRRLRDDRECLSMQRDDNGDNDMCTGRECMYLFDGERTSADGVVSDAAENCRLECEIELL